MSTPKDHATKAHGGNDTPSGLAVAATIAVCVIFCLGMIMLGIAGGSEQGLTIDSIIAAAKDIGKVIGIAAFIIAFVLVGVAALTVALLPAAEAVDRAVGDSMDKLLKNGEDRSRGRH